MPPITLTRRTPYKRREELQIECPSCHTGYLATRVNVLMDEGSGTVVCMVCPHAFDFTITKMRTLLGVSILEVTTQVRAE